MILEKINAIPPRIPIIIAKIVVIMSPPNHRAKVIMTPNMAKPIKKSIASDKLIMPIESPFCQYSTIN